MKIHALGGLSAQDFLRRHWQKKPLLARGALPGFRGVASREQLLALSSRPDVESRLVRRSGARWSVVHGPLARTALRRVWIGVVAKKHGRVVPARRRDEAGPARHRDRDGQ